MKTLTPTEGLPWRLKPFPELVRLAWPITVSMLSYSVMTLVDTIFAGRLGASALGAVGFGGVVTFTVFCFGMGLLRAPKIIVSQAVGAGLRGRVAGSIGAGLVVAVVLGFVTATVGQIVSLELPHVADESAAVKLAQRYVAIRLFGAPLLFVGYVIREVRCALSDARSPMRAALLANLLHVPLNATLIFALGLGVAGAAISTVISQAVEMALLLVIQREDGYGLAQVTRRDVRELWNVGWPLGVERFLNVASFTVLVSLVARTSDTDLAAHQVAHQVNLFAILPMMSVAEAAAVLAGQAVGANEDDLVKRIARTAAFTGTAYGIVCAFVYVTCGPLLVHALSSEPAVRHLAVRLLWIGAAWQAFDALYLVGGSVLRGAGDVRFATTAMVVIAWVVTPPLVLLLGVHFRMGAVGGWLALLAEWAVGAGTLWLRIERGGFLRAAHRARARLRSFDAEDLVPAPLSP